MTEEELDIILLAWYYSVNGDPIKDAFDTIENKTKVQNVESAFILVCEELFGKDFISNWYPEE